MKYLSLFTGIGGFELGIQQAYEQTKNSGLVGNGNEDNRLSRGQETLNSAGVGDKQTERLRDGSLESTPTCIGYSEIDKYAIQIYQKHYPEHTNYGDITKIDPATLPDFDFLCGGFPCQAFSIAGKRLGFADTRGTLFFDIARILKEKHPRLFLLENVKGLLSHDNGNTFKTIIATLDELGYDLQWQIINSKNHGVPQNRERVFIVGHLRGTPRPKVFPFGQADRATDEGLKQGDTEVASTLRSRYGNGSGSHVQRYPLKFLQRNQKNIEGDYSFTIDSVNTGGIKQGAKIRRLTPTECERLQGFPDGWTEFGEEFDRYGIDNVRIFRVERISDTQRYKTLGNAVTVNVIRDIITRLLPNLKES